jgi:hypothetical protein
MSAQAGGVSRRGSHRLAEAALCPRKWYFRWARGLVPKRTPLHFMEGTLVHLALAYYRAEQMDQRLSGSAPEWFYRQSMNEALAETGAGYPDAIQLSKDILKAYKANYAAYDPWEPVGIEHEYTATLGQIRKLVNPYWEPCSDDNEVVSSRIDLVLRTNGYLWACDYKTTAHANRGRLAQFNPDGEYAVNWQFLLQTAILRVNLGDEFRGVLVERILKKPPFDFDRAVAPISRRAFLDLPNVLARQCLLERQIAKQALDAQALGEDMGAWLPSGNWWNCYQWGSPCEYRPICTAETDGQAQDVVVREYNQL